MGRHDRFSVCRAVLDILSRLLPASLALRFPREWEFLGIDERPITAPEPIGAIDPEWTLRVLAVVWRSGGVGVAHATGKCALVHKIGFGASRDPAG